MSGGAAPVRVLGRPLRPVGCGLALGEPIELELDRGRIAAVRPATRDDPHAAGGRDLTLLPGLRDPHLHAFGWAGARRGLDLAAPRAASIPDLLERLADLHRRLAPGAWLRASGYDEAWLAERRHPTRVELDLAAPGRPVRLRHATRHASVLSTPAWQRFERRYGRPGSERAPRDASGAPLGVVFGLEPEVSALVGPLPAAELAAGLADLGRALLALGVVAFDEPSPSNDAERISMLAEARAAGALPQRVRAFVGDADEIGPARRAAGGEVEIAGVKLVAGSAEEVAGSGFRRALARARRAGAPVAVHAVEPDAIAAVAAALAGSGRSLRLDRIEHASLCPPGVARELTAAGVAVVTQPGFLRSRGEKYRREVERPLRPFLYPLRDWLEAGVEVAASSDAPVGPLDPRQGILAACDRRTETGARVGPEQAIGERAALGLWTDAAARVAGGRHSPVGLWPRPGDPADLVVAAGDPSGGRWLALEVRSTWVDGRPAGRSVADAPGAMVHGDRSQ